MGGEIFVWGILIVACISIIVLPGRLRRTGAGSGARAGKRALSAAAAWPSRKPPEALGVPEWHPARPAAERLDGALSSAYEQRVKDRLLAHKPGIGQAEWDWTWFELKRYFLMCGIVGRVPMYSGKADAVWHEMLMFTREYEDFCKRFCGSMIHHAPHAAEDAPGPGHRAWFDWVYGELFEMMPSSAKAWGTFYRTALPADLLEHVRTGDRAALRERLFNAEALRRHPADLGAAADHLLDRLERQLQAARKRELPSAAERRDDRDSSSATIGAFSGMLLYYSVLEPESVEERLHELQTEEEDGKTGSSGYADSGSGSDYAHRDDDGGPTHGGGDSGDGGGSSCSSGSSCGSGGGCSS